MATVLSGNAPFETKRITLSGTPDNVTQVTVPSWAKKVSVQFITNAGKISHTGTDAAAIGSDYITIAADTLAEVSISNREHDASNYGGFSLYLASGTASTVAEVAIEAG